MTVRTYHPSNPFNPPFHPIIAIWDNRLQARVGRVASKLYKSLWETHGDERKSVCWRKSFGVYLSPFPPTGVNSLILQIVERVICRVGRVDRVRCPGVNNRYETC